MKQTIFINNRRILLDASQLIQSGGEGMVFDLGDTAVKLYHTPNNLHQQKVQALRQKQLPNSILAPCQPVTNKKGKFIGFQMPKLPLSSMPFKRLGNTSFWQKQNLQAQSVAILLQTVQETLSRLHKLGVIVGDLNDTNLFFAPNPHSPNKQACFSSFWVDVDSYQFGPHPCPVAMDAFLDPNLYHIPDFTAQPSFTPQTDWYAFAVLLTKSLLQLHPYGGMHRVHKSLRSRAQAKISILNTAVTLPKRARPLESLSDELLHELHLMFDRGQRRPFSSQALTRYANNLITCPACKLSYPGQRSGCPGCRHQTPAPTPITAAKQRLLFSSDGFIEHVALRQNGRLQVITRSGTQYRLAEVGMGGTISNVPLFTGTPGYRFGIFGNYLVVNPPQRSQLLILDISRPQPQQVTMIETAMFRNTAVFAATNRHLYRIAGTLIMQGSVQNGLYVEDAVATAHQRQTQLAASPYHDIIAGYHRIFAEHRFFLRDAAGHEHQLALPPLPRGAHIAETAVLFSPHNLGVALKIGHNKQFHTEIHTFSLTGNWVKADQLAGGEWETAVSAFPNMPANSGEQWRHHPKGTLIISDNQIVIHHS